MKANGQYIYISGSKGGVGKSMFAQVLADCISQHRPVLLIDTDPINAESSTVYADGKAANVRAVHIKVRLEDTRGQTDATSLLATLDASYEDDELTTIVDAPSSDAGLLSMAARIITSSCNNTGRESVFIWLVDSIDKSAVTALQGAWESLTDFDKILIVKNYRNGDRFEYFASSSAVMAIAATGNMQIVAFPKIPSHIEKYMRIDALPLCAITTKTPLGVQMMAKQMRAEIQKTLMSTGLLQANYSPETLHERQRA